MTDWAEGRINPSASAECVAEAMLYKELAAIDYEEIEFFYQK